jgi:hypothetical protein
MSFFRLFIISSLAIVLCSCRNLDTSDANTRSHLNNTRIEESQKAARDSTYLVVRNVFIGNLPSENISLHEALNFINKKIRENESCLQIRVDTEIIEKLAKDPKTELADLQKKKIVLRYHAISVFDITQDIMRQANMNLSFKKNTLLLRPVKYYSISYFWDNLGPFEFTKQSDGKYIDMGSAGDFLEIALNSQRKYTRWNGHCIVLDNKGSEEHSAWKDKHVIFRKHPLLMSDIVDGFAESIDMDYYFSDDENIVFCPKK